MFGDERVSISKSGNASSGEIEQAACRQLIMEITPGTFVPFEGSNRRCIDLSEFHRVLQRLVPQKVIRAETGDDRGQFPFVIPLKKIEGAEGLIAGSHAGSVREILSIL
jgi:hypothetical protein